MGKKKTTEEVKQILQAKGYRLLVEYEKNNRPMLCEKDGFFFNIRLDNFQEGKTPSLWGQYNYSNFEHNILQYLKNRKADCVYLSNEIIRKSKKVRILVRFQCSCGNEFPKTLDDVLSNKYLQCQQCAIRNRGHSHRKGSHKVIDYIESQGYEVLDKTQDYITSDYVEVKDSEGYYGFVKDAGLKSGKGMSRFDIRSNKKHYITNVNHWAKLNGINVVCTGFSDKQYCRQGLMFKCECGNEFITSIASFQNGKIVCDECSRKISRYEKSFKQFLEDEHIEHIYQYSLNQCRDTLPLPFDFYLPKFNLLIEIDGEGHYRPCHFNQIGHKDAMTGFEITQKHDAIKNEFCRSNNLLLLRIPYTKFKDKTYKDFFFQFIKGVAPLN